LALSPRDTVIDPLARTRAIVDLAVLRLQVQQDLVSSNLSLYACTSNSVLVGPQIRF